jgi:phosphoribosylaminoimidazolecarboxamide formyltransferase/IMP cyclohydrolase
MFRNALISVSDKTGIVDLARFLHSKGTRIVSTGGTSKLLRAEGIPTIDVSEQTGFSEVMDGRVKTLHPRIHMALLSRSGHEADNEILRAHELDPFDLVVCNLYPFEQTLKESAGLARHEEIIEAIDVGGPSMIRAGAKNFSRVTVVTSPHDYESLKTSDAISLRDRQNMAGKAFAHLSRYDALIAEYLSSSDTQAEWPRHAREVSFPGVDRLTLRYGENPHQWAKWFVRPGATAGWHEAEILQGKELSYNNILDLDAAVSTLFSFTDPTVVCVKHNNPCGVSSHASIDRAVELSLKSDPVSIFGGIVACNAPIGRGAAAALTEIFLECIVAPEFSAEALEILATKKNLRVLRWGSLESASSAIQQYPKVIQIAGGWLVQDWDKIESWTSEWKIIAPDSATKLSQQVRDDAAFAWKVCAALKSNAISICSGGQTLGLGMGQVNRVDAVDQALRRATQNHLVRMDHAVLASDAFFPFADSIELMAAAGIRYVIHPGGSRHDENVLGRAKELGLTTILTGRRHFRH